MKATTEKTSRGFKPVVEVAEGIKLKIKEEFPYENTAMLVAEQTLKDLKNGEQTEI